MTKTKNVASLKPAPYNPRKISDWQLEALGKSMREFGDLSGIVFNICTGRICGGHQRVKHLDASWAIEKTPYSDDVGTVALGHIETPFGRWQYREVDWDETKELAANVAANKHSGEWDFPKLKDIFTELDTGDFDTDLLGFDGDELKGIMGFVPDVQPGQEDEQGKLDQKKPVECPECGAEFVPKG